MILGSPQSLPVKARAELRATRGASSGVGVRSSRGRKHKAGQSEQQPGEWSMGHDHVSAAQQEKLTKKWRWRAFFTAPRVAKKSGDEPWRAA